MRHSENIKDEFGAGAENPLGGAILIALGLSMFVINEWSDINVRTTVGLAWGIFFLLLKGPELVRLLKRTE